MIQPVHDRFHRPGDLRMVVDPADFWVHLAFDCNLKLERMAMHFGAFVIPRKIRQRLGGLETEVFDDACAHDWVGESLNR